MPKPPRMTVFGPNGDQANPNRCAQSRAWVALYSWWLWPLMIELYGVAGLRSPAARRVSNGAFSNEPQLVWQTGLEFFSARRAKVRVKLWRTFHSSCA